MLNFLPKGKLTWLAILVLVYAFFVAPEQARKEEARKERQTEYPRLSYSNKEEEPSFLESPVNTILEKLKETETGQTIVQAMITRGLQEKYGTQDVYTILSQQANALYVTDTLKGSGSTVSCGSTVNITYQLYVDHSILVENRSKPFSFVIGKKQVVPGLETGLVGMQEKGKRMIYVPAYLGFDHPGFNNDLIARGKPVRYDVELKKITNRGIKKLLPVNTYDNNEGEGKELACGDTAHLNINFRSLQGTSFYENFRTSFVVGDNEIFKGLEHGVIGMRPGGIRTLVFDYQTVLPYLKNFSENIKPSSMDNIIMEVTLLSEAAEKTEETN
jgi:FKBP-type peptidyl-prolyl cis-trans isomerase